MDIIEFQRACLERATFADGVWNAYTRKKIVGEAGEYMDVLGKEIRKQKTLTESRIEELGDCWWYVVVIAYHLRINVRELYEMAIKEAEYINTNYQWDEEKTTRMLINHGNMVSMFMSSDMLSRVRRPLQSYIGCLVGLAKFIDVTEGEIFKYNVKKLTENPK